MNRKKVDINAQKDGRWQSQAVQSIQQSSKELILQGEKRNNKRQQECDRRRKKWDRHERDREGKLTERENPKQEDVLANILITVLKKRTWWQSFCHPSSEQMSRREERQRLYEE